ncbi:MAG: c-type cytochrome [Gammaproteobacteria bacterium]|nr:c-type cytochrome [Gammaproteobacteria bacterium]
MKRQCLINGVLGLALFALGSTAFAATKNVTDGKQIYEQNCIYCHQADAIGKAGFAPSLTNKELLSVASDKFFMSTIRDGRTGTGMPPFAHLGKKGIKDVVAYLRTFEKVPNRSRSIDAQPASYGDARQGKFWFNQICVTCHGVEGKGYANGVVGTAIGNKDFLRKVSDGFIRETVKHGRSNTRMLGFTGPEGLANLTPAEIEDIIAYMRTLDKGSDRGR